MGRGLPALHGFALAALLVAGPARAEPRLEVGLRTGLAVPLVGDRGGGTGADVPTDESETKTGTLRGPEYVNLQGGVDVAIEPGLALGGFLAATWGEYREQVGPCNPLTPYEERPPILVAGGSSSTTFEALDEPRSHAWLLLGARVTWLP